jgi:hypothetical protein
LALSTHVQSVSWLVSWLALWLALVRPHQFLSRVAGRKTAFQILVASNQKMIMFETQASEEAIHRFRRKA